MICFDDIYRGRRVLITGHTGFKGSWLGAWLESLGAEVAGYALEASGSPSHFELLGLGSRIVHHAEDIRDRARLAQVIDEFRPEVVFHLAAQALVRKAYADPATTFETNIMGMVNLLECVRTRPWIEVAVLITSDKAYRNEEWCWGYRETDVLGGRDPYGGSKGCADLVAQAYFQSFLQHTPTRVGIVRAGNVIGGGDWSEDRIVPDCIRAWTNGRAVSVRSPKATRPWLHVLEPLSGYLWLGARLWKDAAGLNGEAFNLSPDVQVKQTVAELLEAMAARWPGAEWQVPKGFEQGGHEDMLLRLSGDKALLHLDWRAILQFPETVALTLDWYREWHTDARSVPACTAGQIESYCRMAQSRGSAWTRA